MTRMLHNEAWELLVKRYKKSHDAAEIAQAYSVSMHRLVELKRKIGSVALRTSQHGRRPDLTVEDNANIRQTTTILSSIRYNGEKVFATYLKETRLLTLHAGDIVVMDNMRSHHVKAVREVLEDKGAIPSTCLHAVLISNSSKNVVKDESHPARMDDSLFGRASRGFAMCSIARFLSVRTVTLVCCLFLLPLVLKIAIEMNRLRYYLLSDTAFDSIPPPLPRVPAQKIVRSV